MLRKCVVIVRVFLYLDLSEYHLTNYEYAILQFNKVLATYDNTCEAHFGLAKTYQKLGDLEQARMHVNRAAETIAYKREDVYNEFLNEIYLSEIIDLKRSLQNEEN